MDLISSLLTDGNDLANVLKSFLGLWWTPMLGVLGASSGVLALFAGLKYLYAIKTGDEQKIKSARNFVVGIIIAIAIIMVLAVVIPILVAWLGDWTVEQTGSVLRMII